MPAKKKSVPNLQELMSASVSNAQVVVRDRAERASNNYLQWRDIAPDITVKNAYSERDYYSFRELEELPTDPKGIMAMGMQYYKKNPIVKNTIDMMSEFAASGMSIAHKSERIQDFYLSFYKKVDIYSINEQFARWILKAGNAVINRSFAKLRKAQIKKMYVGLAADQDFPEIEYVKAEIPISYSFLQPLHVILPQEEISMLTGKRRFFLRLPESLIRIAQQMKKKELDAFLKEFPPEIAEYLRKGEHEFPLDPYKVSVYHYKKDDCEVWGEPVHACVLDDLIHYDKVKLADRTTLDSIASQIRLWKVGHLEKDNNVVPSDAALEKLNELLASIPSGGIADILWNSAIDVMELSKDAYKFLGPEKYKAPLNAIYQGLGVPRTVNDDNSFNNSYFGLKTMVERLNYVRNMLKQFWTGEFKLIHNALGFTGDAPVVMFDEISITDKSQMMALVRDLVDRNVISEQECQRLFNTVPEIESYRVKKENRRKENDSMPPKAGPFHSTNTKSELKKIALTKGIVKPTDVGIDSSLSDKQIMGIVKPSTPKGQPGQGRPKNSADKNGRKKRIVKPRSAMANLWYIAAQNKIQEFLVNKSLEKFGKKNIRQLATAETERIEKEKFAILYNLPLGEDLEKINFNGVNNLLEEDVIDKYNSLIASFVKTFSRQPNTEEQRILQIEVCLNKE